MSIKIKPCPHCGGAAGLCADYDMDDIYSIDGRYIVFVQCKVCGARGKEFQIFDEDDNPHKTGNWDIPECKAAMDAWNLRRADSEYEALMKDAINSIADLKKLTAPLLKEAEQMK